MAEERGSASRIDLPALPEAPRMARTFVRDAFETVDADTLDRITLCVSELVTNAVDHAGPPIALCVTCDDDRLRIEVHDASNRRPEPRDVSPSSLRGRGMHLVADTASKWGVDSLPTGKSVWAEFAAGRRSS
jgi:anti-sigma regulatory factor (Ser/Thr protein kinase)